LVTDEQLDSLQRLIQRIRAGERVSKAWHAEQSVLVSNPELQAVAARILKTANQVGAPVVPALERLVQVQLHKQSAQADLEAEFAAPKATAKLVSVLPFAFLALAQLMGLPIVQAFAQSNLAKVSVAIGGGLLLIARRWSRRILKNAQPRAEDPAQILELVVIALNGGMGFGSALQKVGADVSTEALLVQERMLARTCGAPIAGLIEARADYIRAGRARADRVRIREASVKLMFPLGAAVLPALILLLVIPLASGFAGGLV
jgi:tight adherence protein B